MVKKPKATAVKHLEQSRQSAFAEKADAFAWMSPAEKAKLFATPAIFGVL